MPPIDQLVALYKQQGWTDDAAIMGDINAGGWKSKVPNGGGTPSFNFDYAGEATKAYGELGTYYDRLLRESQGDLTKVLSRLVQDYETGTRLNKENTAIRNTNLDTTEANTKQNVINNSLARGLYQPTAYGETTPAGPVYGIADTTLEQRMLPIRRSREAISLDFTRNADRLKTNLDRQQTDLPEAQRRKEFQLEQSRRTEASNLAETRGTRAYNDYLARLNNYG